MTRLRRFALLLALCPLAACDTAGSDSSFTATLSGAVDARLGGSAGFGPSGGDRYQLLLRLDEGESDGFRGSLGFYFDGTDRPAAGTYAIGSDDPGGVDVSIVLNDSQGAISLVGRGGTLTLTGASDDLMEGTFDFEAGTVFGGGETAVTGAFTAEPE